MRRKLSRKLLRSVNFFTLERSKSSTTVKIYTTPGGAAMAAA
jgi:hypothetical protein